MAGGSGTAGVLASVEVFDPVTKAFSAVGSLAAGRVFHTATLLQSGKVGRRLYGSYVVASTSLASASPELDIVGKAANGTHLSPPPCFLSRVLPPTRQQVLIAGGAAVSIATTDGLSSTEVFWGSNPRRFLRATSRR